MEKEKNKGEILLNRIMTRPKNSLEKKVAEAMEEFNSDFQAYNVTRAFSMLFGTEIDLTDNVYFAFLKDYMNAKGKVLTEEQTKDLVSTYKLDTPDGIGIFAADKLYAETMGDELAFAVFDYCGLKANNKNIEKIKRAIDIANFYTQETATFMTKFESNEEFCNNVITFCNVFCKRLAENKKENEK